MGPLTKRMFNHAGACRQVALGVQHRSTPSGSLHVKTASIVGWCVPFRTRNLQRLKTVKCGDTFFNSVRFCFCWSVFAAMSRRHSISGITHCRQAMTLNTAW